MPIHSKFQVASASVESENKYEHWLLSTMFGEVNTGNKAMATCTCIWRYSHYLIQITNITIALLNMPIIAFAFRTKQVYKTNYKSTVLVIENR